MKTIRETLESYRELKYDAMRLLKVYRRLHAEIGIGSVSYDGMPKGHSISSKTERDATKLAEAYKDYAERMTEAMQRMIEIESLIDRVTDPRGRYVLHERYIELRSIDDIGLDDAINRCGRQARRYHDDAIAELEELNGTL